MVYKQRLRRGKFISIMMHRRVISVFDSVKISQPYRQLLVLQGYIM